MHSALHMGLATPVLNAYMLLCHSPGGFHAKPGRTRRYQVPDAAARTIAALLTIRDQVIAPLLAGIRTPRRGRPPATWTRIYRDYEALRVDMHTLFQDLGLTTAPAAA